MDIITRPQWGAKSPESPLTPWNPNSLFGCVVHWFGLPNGPADHALCDDVMRSVQTGHQNGEFVDIAYNFVVCQHGKAYEGRGFKYQTGANGTTDSNRHYAAICAMYGIGDYAAEFTDPVRQAISLLIKEWRSRGAGLAVRNHGYFTGSQCPGPFIEAWVNGKGYNKWIGGTTPMPDVDGKIPDWLDDFVYWRLVLNSEPDLRPASVPEEISEEVWQFTSAMHRLATHFGMSEGEQEWIAWKRDGADPTKRPAVPTKIPDRWWDDLQFTNKEVTG
jgi:hypothetical protein